MNQHCWILIGACRGGAWRVRRRRPVAGAPAWVQADWEWTLAREERRGDVAGFWHTHPAGAGTGPSERDVRTMRAWCSALGKPLLCLVAEGGRVSATVFDGEGSAGQAVTAPVRIERGLWQVAWGRGG